MKNIPKADKEMLKRAEEFIEKNGLFHKFCLFYSNQFLKWIGKSEWLHSDRWSAVYDWVRTFDSITEIPEGIEACLVEYMETRCLHLKKEE